MSDDDGGLEYDNRRKQEEETLENLDEEAENLGLEEVETGRTPRGIGRYGKATYVDDAEGLIRAIPTILVAFLPVIA